MLSRLFKIAQLRFRLANCQRYLYATRRVEAEPSKPKRKSKLAIVLPVKRGKKEGCYRWPKVRYPRRRAIREDTDPLFEDVVKLYEEHWTNEEM